MYLMQTIRCVKTILVFLLNFFKGKFINNPHNRKVAESQLYTQIVALLEHYKQNDPRGIPGW